MTLTVRKADHLRIAAGTGVGHTTGTGFEQLRLRHHALPERNLDDVSLGTEFLGAHLGAPLIISAMTGGTPEAGVINARLARAATEHGLALALGSGRALLDDPSWLDTYRLTDRPPLLLANLGAAQIRHAEGVEWARRLVSLLDADGLTVHLNPIQEAVQPEGEPDFDGVADAIALLVCDLAPLPIVVKEVGFGMDADDIVLLRDAGVAAIDLAGSGGTNWALVEGRRDDRAAAVASAFADWGVPTATALTMARTLAPEVPLIASGGLRDGVDAAKALALGASAAGLARPFLLAAQADTCTDMTGALIEQLRVATWAAGAERVTDLSTSHLQLP